MAVLLGGYGPVMSKVKTRIALAGGRYLVTHPRGRITRLVVPFAARRVSKKLAAATHADAIPATGGSRLTTVAGIAVVAGGIVALVRRAAKPAATASAGPVAPPFAPFPPAAATPPETRDSAPTSPTTSTAAEAAAADRGADDDALAARVQDKLFGGAPPAGVTVGAHSGVVTLRGRVADEAAAGRFVHDAETIPGVKAVRSELQTAGSEPGPRAS